MCAVARESRERESGERGWEGDSVIEKVMAAGAEEGWLIRKVFVPLGRAVVEEGAVVRHYSRKL